MAIEHLIIFTRYPEPGKTKTRLIATLGAEGAATLQRQMTENTISQVRKLLQQRPLVGEIHFAGGNQSLMAQWLGSDLVYQPQGSGDLGERMARALSTAFSSGAESAVIIGTDCPGLSAAIIAKAFNYLHYDCDLVLGPALDGGYYLLGLGRFVPELFTGISWSTAEVLSQTANIAKQLNLSVAYLPQLADVDRPEDLPVWEQMGKLQR